MATNNSYVDYRGDGSTKAYDVPFDYINKSHVKVLVDNKPVPFSWPSKTKIYLDATPKAGTLVSVQRNSSQTKRLVQYEMPGNLTEEDLNRDSKQAFFMAQEALDSLRFSIKYDNALQAYNANGLTIKNVGNPVDFQDVATKTYVLVEISKAVFGGEGYEAPEATEVSKGVARIATDAEALEGLESGAVFVTPTQVVTTISDRKLQPYLKPPEMAGTATEGTEDRYARGDHVHPIDKSRAALTDVKNLSKDLEELTKKVDFKILYPGGSESAPAIMTTNKRVVIENPFGTARCIVQAQVKVAGKWGGTGHYTDNSAYYFVEAAALGDEIVVQSASTALVCAPAVISGHPFGPISGGHVYSAPYRVLVWRIGN